MKEFIVLRMCNKADGTVAAPVATYETQTEAEKEYYRLLGQAVDSTHLSDCVYLLTKDGLMIMSKCYNHPAQEGA